MKPRLYSMSISHPSAAARLMLEHKGIDYDLVDIPPMAQAAWVRLAGFRGGTVPALKIDGRRVQGSLAISRAIEQHRPDPPLFPADPEHRRAVEEAEAWGERVLQPVPRRLLRWMIRNEPDVRLKIVKVLGNPQPELAARAVVPVAAFYARREEAYRKDRILADWAALPGYLDHVDRLIEDGVIGGAELNAADFQIGTTLRAMLSAEDLAPLVAGRPQEALARRVSPEWSFDVPLVLPPGWNEVEPQPVG